MRDVLLEVCVDSPEGLAAAVEGGADRIELCAALGLGGLMPAPGLMARAARIAVPVMVLIRPVAGGFVYDQATVEAAVEDIRAAKALGLAGVVVGAGGPEGLDLPVMERLMAAADGMDVTLHRVIDVIGPWERALDQAMALGIRRVLSSGGAATALAGIERLAAMETRSGGRLVVMPGSGVTAETVGPILRRLETPEVHASCSATEAADPALVRLGFAGETVRRTSAAVVRGMKRAM